VRRPKRQDAPFDGGAAASPVLSPPLHPGSEATGGEFTHTVAECASFGRVDPNESLLVLVHPRMSPVASPNLTPSAAAPVTLFVTTVKAQPTELPATRVHRDGTPDAPPMPPTRVKQVHPADLALLSSAARSIRLRG